MVSIAHIVNPFCTDGVDNKIIHPVTLQTMDIARTMAEVGGLKVEQLSAQYKEDHKAVPNFLRKTSDLTRSIQDIGKFESTKKLPLIKDILNRAYEESSAEWIVYTNMDIAVCPQFYLAIEGLIDKGHDAFVLNKRIVPLASYNKGNVNIALMFSEVGWTHRGTDCFIFNRSVYPKFNLGSVCIGVQWIGVVLAANMERFSENFTVFPQCHATFSLLNRTTHSHHPKDIRCHNENEAARILESFSNTKGDASPEPRGRQHKFRKDAGNVPKHDRLRSNNIFAFLRKNQDVFIETGTFKGDGVSWAKDHFNQVLSIEIDETVHRENVEKFKSNTNVRILLGDSKDVLPKILSTIDEPCFFWLDAHYSGGDSPRGEVAVPILQELEAIGKHHIKNHVIVIDDLRLFGTSKWWKDITEDGVADKLWKINERYEIIQYKDVLIAALKEDTWNNIHGVVQRKQIPSLFSV